MEYSLFKALLSEGENERVDFKIRCDAFQGSNAANADLVKDICTMANNGNRVSYLIIGVSDDLKQSSSVKNEQLIDENIQHLCSQYISPIPSIKVWRGSFVNAAPEHKDIQYVTIKIGPHPRTVFSISKDIIDFSSKVCVRKNEVWIRRGSTSVYADVQAIISLYHKQSIKKTFAETDQSSYTRLPIRDRSGTIRSDLIDCLRSLEFQQLEGNKICQRLLTKFRNTSFVWDYVVIDDEPQSFSRYWLISRYWSLSHGIVVVSYPKLNRAYLKKMQCFDDVVYPCSWGWYCTLIGGRGTLSDLPYSVDEVYRLPIFLLDNVIDADTLRDKLITLVRYITEDETVFQQCLQCRDTLNRYINKKMRLNQKLDNPEINHIKGIDILVKEMVKETS